ncbi:MAG: ketopantoate reductase family protein [Lautropia sp.]
MRLCVFGAGAVGGYLAARLLQTGLHEVSVVARGAHLRAIRANGLRLIAPGEEFVVRPHAATDRAQALPPQDVVFVTLKAHAQPAAAEDIAGLLGESGSAVFASNGVPWWWHFRGERERGAPLPLLDPVSSLWLRVRPERALGCVLYSANETIAPGVVRHSANNRWLLGEPDGTCSSRLREAVAVLRAAGIGAEAVDDIRAQVWAKLLRNAPLNSLCALARLPVEGLADDPALTRLCGRVVDEIAAIAAGAGVRLGDHVEAAKAAPRLGGTIDGTRPVGIRPSMLQDLEQGRATEVDAILGQVVAFARDLGIATPVLDVLLPLIRALSRGVPTSPAGDRLGD